VLRYAIYFFVAITVIEALEVPTASIIASAGIVGLAVGFGAQNLVRDVLTGFFMRFEGQLAVGDYMEAVGLAGVVEGVGLRVTRLRDFRGLLHIVPSGTIDKVSSHNRGHLRAVAVVFRLWARTERMQQWDVEREIRRLVKLAFDRAGIQTPYLSAVLVNPRPLDKETGL